MATGIKRNSSVGLAPYGFRHSGDAPKGKGYFGEIETPDGSVMTELSSENEDGEYPLVVPTLTKKEIQHLSSGKEPTDEIYEKAESWAKSRAKAGKSPFATREDLRTPVPKKKGGLVKSASSRADGIARRGKTRGKII